MMRLDEIDVPRERNLLVGFYDLTQFLDWARLRPPVSLLGLMAGYFELTGGIVEAAGGAFVKAVGDAGLAVFPEEKIEEGLAAFLRVKAEGDAWLAARGIESEAQVRLDFGPVALGRVAGRVDVYGPAVNAAAVLRGGTFVVSRAVHQRLGPAWRRRFARAGRRDGYVLA